ncbi:Os08g0431800 [Oryza sativa Japonica Group]|uniref:Os08g0432000 protein n=3 Tax=Oryza sativa TaxID=4530 RepID=B9G117_ORYSJ|nr:hypothetical protein OsI_29328 [Oryza sativa Indica Group]EEE68734.1 hypothetical protein OsJ_27413 [Oryza sativa Japonica Group]KAB8108617.1 hypothetical protein EE612_044453 [Oryza sativa]BAC99344.1 unknown protein [Oryza sativa Japonica Group]BAH94322.1 Os08g0432000 [Oryza sativa Japonica Group]|eukprot:NP_001175594.1 Os08g0432000 [Oryza sativa Japonica Group]
MPPLLRPPDLGFYWSRRAQRPADHGRGRGDQICNWGQQARGGNCIICKKLLAEDHTDDILASYAVAASSLLPPVAKASKMKTLN